MCTAVKKFGLDFTCWDYLTLTHHYNIPLIIQWFYFMKNMNAGSFLVTTDET